MLEEEKNGRHKKNESKWKNMEGENETNPPTNTEWKRTGKNVGHSAPSWN